MKRSYILLLLILFFVPAALCQEVKLSDGVSSQESMLTISLEVTCYETFGLESVFSYDTNFLELDSVWLLPHIKEEYGASLSYNPIQQGELKLVVWTLYPLNLLKDTLLKIRLRTKQKSGVTKIVINEITINDIEAIYIEEGGELLIRPDSPPENLLIPNVFSPNGDGYNDYFEIRGAGEQLSIVIYNVQGEIVFQSDDFNKWDGTRQGMPIASGENLYYWLSVGKNQYRGVVRIEK